MAPKRKGGAKGFLKSAARAGAESSDDIAPEEASGAKPPLEVPLSKDDATPANVPQKVQSPPTTVHPTNGSAAATEPGTAPNEGGAGGGGEETRGQMLQRHKRVPLPSSQSVDGIISRQLQRDNQPACLTGGEGLEGDCKEDGQKAQGVRD